MQVRRTKSGLSLNLNWRVRIALYQSLVDAIKTCEASKFHDEKAVMEALQQSVLTQVLHRKNFNIEWSKDSRLSLTVTEAISIMWHLRRYDNTTALLHLKSEIHKQLHA